VIAEAPKKKRVRSAAYHEYNRAYKKRRYRALTPEQKAERLAKRKVWYHKNKSWYRKKEREREHRNGLCALKARKRWLKSQFGMTVDDYDAMVEKQKGVCAICNKAEIAIDNRSGKARPLAVDHCHSTGRVRGLLCMMCNTAIGKLKDSPALLLAAFSYLLPKGTCLYQAVSEYKDQHIGEPDEQGAEGAAAGAGAPAEAPAAE
jgi:hypothetical protein